MYVFYLDETGNTGTNLDDPDQPVFWLIALAVPSTQIRAVELDMLAIASGLTSDPTSKEFEFHGADIYGGKGRFRDLSVADRIKIYESISALVEKYDLKVFCRAINKERHKRRAEERGYDPRDPYDLVFPWMAEEIDRWLDRAARESGEIACGLLVADEQREKADGILDRFEAWRVYGTTLGYQTRRIAHIVDTVHYVPSCRSWLIQLADCVAHLVGRYHKIERERGWELKGLKPAEEVMVNLKRKYLEGRIADWRIWPQ